MAADTRAFYGVDSSREGSAPAPIDNSGFEKDMRNFYGVDSRASSRAGPQDPYSQPPPQQSTQQANNPYGN